VDGASVISGASWPAGPVLIRPTAERDALECAEILLRSTGFAMVVLAGVRPHPMAHVRLARAAREGGGALVLMEGGWWIAGRSRSATSTSAAPFAADSRVTAWRVRARKSRASGKRAFAPPSGGSVALDVETRIDADAYRWRQGPSGPALAESVRIHAKARAGGLERSTRFHLPIAIHEHRMSLDAGLADRRGTPRPARRA
jgi:hypothetical protein